MQQPLKFKILSNLQFSVVFAPTGTAEYTKKYLIKLKFVMEEHAADSLSHAKFDPHW